MASLHTITPGGACSWISAASSAVSPTTVGTDSCALPIPPTHWPGSPCIPRGTPDRQPQRVRWLLAEAKRRQYRAPSVIPLHSRDTEYGHDVITGHVLNRAAILRHFTLCETVHTSSCARYEAAWRSPGDIAARCAARSPVCDCLEAPAGRYAVGRPAAGDRLGHADRRSGKTSLAGTGARRRRYARGAYHRLYRTVPRHHCPVDRWDSAASLALA